MPTLVMRRPFMSPISPEAINPMINDRTRFTPFVKSKEIITAENPITGEQLIAKLSESDSVWVTMKSKIISNCQHSGCWMYIDIGNEEVMQVLFKDGDFTIPIESAGKTAILNGIAYREQLEITELKAMAKDDGKSEAEINLIIEPSWEYSFVAEGVIFQ